MGYLIKDPGSLKPLEHDTLLVSRGLTGTLKWVPMMPIVTSVPRGLSVFRLGYREHTNV